MKSDLPEWHEQQAGRSYRIAAQFYQPFLLEPEKIEFQGAVSSTRIPWLHLARRRSRGDELPKVMTTSARVVLVS